MANQQQLADAVNQSISIMAESDRDNLIPMLKRSGSLVNENSTYDELLNDSLIKLKDSARFREDLNNYINSSIKTSENEANFLNSVGRPPINISMDVLKTAEVKAQQMTTPPASTGGSKVGNFFRGLFTKEELQGFAKDTVKFGIDLAKTKIQNKANQQGNQQAIEFTKLEIEKKKEENKALGNTPPADDEKKNKWVLPVAIGGGVILLGVIIYFVTKKKAV